MSLREIESHQLLFAMATFITALILEIFSILIVQSITNRIIETPSYPLIWIILGLLGYSAFLMVATPWLPIYIYIPVYNVYLKNINYEASDDKKIGSTEIYLYAIPSVSLLIATRLYLIFDNMYLLLVGIPIYYVVYRMYKLL